MEDFLSNFDNWLCGVCREGDANYGARTTHACGQHEFHADCLERVRERDARCPLCRYPNNATPPTYSQETELQGSDTPDSQPSPQARGRFYSAEQIAFSHQFHRPRELIPQHLNENRRRVCISQGYGIGKTCAYCQQIIEEPYHAQPGQCSHHMHDKCVVQNISWNGINLYNSTVFCPACHHRDM